jgi:hypothetical protein
MSDELNQLTDERLRILKQQCLETLEAVSDRMSGDLHAQGALRRLLTSDDMLKELGRIEAESRDLAALVLQGAVAVLVNSESVKTIDAELERRISERN